jgi:hypothetical protein
MFQSVSLSSGTGFTTADWKVWAPLAQGVLVLLMAIGPCAGSTGGGMKVVRAMLLARHAWQEVFRLLHPQAVTLLKFGGRAIPERLRMAFLGFFFIYVAALAVGTLLMALHGLALGPAFGSVFACLNITGTYLGPSGRLLLRRPACLGQGHPHRLHAARAPRALQRPRPPHARILEAMIGHQVSGEDLYLRSHLSLFDAQ